MLTPVTIQNGASLSAVGDVGPDNIFYGIQMDLLGWTAASITFQLSTDGVTFGNGFDNAGNEVTITTPTFAEVILFNNVLFNALMDFRFMKIRSGTSGAPVNQLALRTLNLISRADR